MIRRTPLQIEIYRGPLVESIHQVVAVVIDEHGSLIKAWGDPLYQVFPRSSIKLLQALPYLQSGAFAKEGQKLERLALACSSHRGESIHLKVLDEWSKEIGITENDLACGPVQGSRWKHNCSGKHLAALAACQSMGLPLQGYHLFEHPFQQEVRKYLTAFSGTDQSRLPGGIDGCGFPTVTMPLQNLAMSFVSFVSDKRKVQIPTEMKNFILSAVRLHSDLFSGSEELTHVLMHKTEGQVIVKTGAEGVYVALVPDRRLVFAVKVIDGATRGAWVSLLSLFHEMKVITTAQFASLMDHPAVALTNSRGELVGSYKIN